MSVQFKKHRPALKHAGYSATDILPGEDPAEFEKLHRDLIAELNPNGALENDVVKTMVRLVWRKENLDTFRIAERARTRYEQIMQEKVPQDEIEYLTFDEYGDVVEKVDPAVREAATRAAEESWELLPTSSSKLMT